MQRDLRDFEATVAIIPVSEDMDETLAKRVLDEFMVVGNSKPNQYTVCFRQMCPTGPMAQFMCSLQPLTVMQASAD